MYCLVGDKTARSMIIFYKDVKKAKIIDYLEHESSHKCDK